MNFSRLAIYLIPSLLSSVAPLSRALNPGISFSISTSKFGPVSPDTESITISVTITPSAAKSQISERLSVGYQGDSLTYIIDKKSHSTLKRVPYKLDFVIPTADFFKGNGKYVGIYGKFNIFVAGESAYESSFRLKPYISETIKVDDYRNEYYVSKDLVGILSKSQTEYTERYKFDLLDYFNVDSYYRLNLLFSTILYESSYAFPACTANLLFRDYDNLFPYIDKNSDGYIEIPLKAAAIGGNIFFTYSKIMYVKPGTLEMSLKSRLGFKSTKYFYLPVNKREQFTDSSFILNVSNFGYNKNSFTHNLRYLADRSFIGSCNSSDYCVIGENA